MGWDGSCPAEIDGDVWRLPRGSTEGALAVDPHLRIVLWSRVMERMLGLSAGQVLGKRCHEVLRGRTPTGTPICRASCLSARAARDQRPIPTQNLMVRNRHQTLLLDVSTLLPSSRRRHAFLLAHLVRDVTEERRLADVGRRVLALVDDCYRPTRHRVALPTGLTRRQTEVLCLMASGATTAALANQLCISLATARNHIHAILDKFGAHSRVEALATAYRQGVVWPRQPERSAVDEPTHRAAGLT